MIVREHVSLRTLTTLRVGGNAALVLDCEHERDVREALDIVQERNLPWYVLGEGSNVCASDEGYPGAVIRILDTSLSFEHDSVVCGAGLSWDKLVDEATKRELWGIENLAGIPGTVGAAPVQNIGAYGAELADTFLWADVFNVRTHDIVRMDKQACVFGYRDSLFKRDESFIILRVALSLTPKGVPRVDYLDLAKLIEAGERLESPAEIAAAVRHVRSRKFPDLSEFGTAGSFFKNPVISAETYAGLLKRYPGMPSFPHTDGVKVPLAWILDNVLSLRGYVMERVELFERQPLVLVTHDGATAADVDALAAYVSERVFDATGITIEREVRTLK
jgi:UDP-N-acetylmuramate dehydrogenase